MAAARWWGILPGSRGHRRALQGGRLGGAVALLLSGLQLGLYLLQENLEAAAGGAALPGLGVFLGVHAAAPLVHVAARITGVARLLRLLLASLAPAAPPPAPAVAWRPSPLDRLGRQLWSRPPPTALPAR